MKRDVILLQAKDGVDYRFFGWEYAQDKFNLDDYDSVGILVSSLSDEDICEMVYQLGNDGTLFEQGILRGHSISVSDIIMIHNTDGTYTHYYVDSFGFKKID